MLVKTNGRFMFCSLEGRPFTAFKVFRGFCADRYAFSATNQASAEAIASNMKIQDEPFQNTHRTGADKEIYAIKDIDAAHCEGYFDRYCWSLGYGASRDRHTRRITRDDSRSQLGFNTTPRAAPAGAAEFGVSRNIDQR